uniref:Uncharacterized protein n=1 Tax=Cricetulus griseus TaxID=10029 RepID=A0A8C2ML90_CRIGR
EAIRLVLPRWPFHASRGRRGESTPAVTSPAPRSLSPGTQLPAPVPSGSGAPWPGARWRVPGRVARSRAQDAPRTRAWPSRPYPQDVVALRAAAWDLDALRGAHGGGRSVRPGRLSAAPPRAPPAPRLRVALGTWHSQPPEPGRTARREIVSGQPRPLRRRRQRPLPGPAGSRGEEPGRARKTAEIRLRARRLAMGPRSGQDSSRAILRSRKKSCLVAAPPGGQRQKKGGSKCQARWTLGLFLDYI